MLCPCNTSDWSAQRGQTTKICYWKIWDILHELCDLYDNLSEIEKKNQLLEYLGLFSRKDNVPDEYYDDTDSDTEYTE